MTTKISSSNIRQTTLDNIGGSPRITAVQVTNSSFVITGATTVGTTGGYVKITGSKFAAGAQVLVDEIPAPSVTVVNGSTIHAQVPARPAGTYFLYVVNTDGSTGISVNGVSYS